MAGGIGARMGAGKPKQMIELDGKPILVHTLQKFLTFRADCTLCVVLHASLLAEWDAFREKWFPGIEPTQITACEGGAQRTNSVANGLEHLANQLSGDPALVGVHDAVRPFVTLETLEAAYKQAKTSGNAVACVPVKSSMRKKTESGSEAIDRSAYYHVQTPQVFWLETLLDYYRRRPGDTFTDDAGLAEAMGAAIQITAGGYDNIKITTPEDLAIAEIIYAKQ